MKSLSIKYQVLPLASLEADDQDLIKKAEDSFKFAHAPYSHFQVASAVRDVNGKVTTGSNQENAAYPSGLCAERVALFAAKSTDRAELDTIVVMARSEESKLADAFSCGSCRQVMMEYASLQSTSIRILMQRQDGDFILVKDVRQLLPFQFDSGQLK